LPRQVLVQEPLPVEAKEKTDSFEDTLLLLDMVRERNVKEAQNKKVTRLTRNVDASAATVNTGGEDPRDGDGAEAAEAAEG
jgi:hypothetical protein